MEKTITVQNLRCGGCVNTITTKISEMENIDNVQVDKETSAVSFQYTEPEDAVKVKDKLKKLGYPEIDDKNSLMSKASSMVSCASGKF
ncbi:MAG: heavy-metal-associated domain-containing protein [Salegentibacter sp.]|uniref:Copper chaperone CopZ n=1 Tax=Salegentibacter flavus TaxID=287099 RepID=A0A1I5BBE6_9FLAO|nr:MULTISPECIES: heavy-metal-associated domain-containing protein [Salegentibacter]MDR9457280.1 heavy-metal-associated domain-containing protein [Salegentibacter sp.]SFN72016.1 Copper chaperone CopZ [Salegentibacter flavus]